MVFPRDKGRFGLLNGEEERPPQPQQDGAAEGAAEGDKDKAHWGGVCNTP
jgi:hypothetical protein